MNFLKAIVLSVMLSTSIQAMAANDSVGVFHKPKKVIVLINELGEGERLQTMMNYFELGQTLNVSNTGENIKLACKRQIAVASCTFTFTPGNNVVIEPKILKAHSTLSELGLTSMDDIEISFQSSNLDKFTLTVSGDVISFVAHKKLQ